MEDRQSFDLLLMIGVFKALKERGILTQDELEECITKIEREESLC